MAISTEGRNPKTLDIDKMSTIQMVEAINGQDAMVAEAVGKAKESIAAAINLAFQTIKNGGRIFYVGSGTSGFLGALDAMEIPPTYNESNWFIPLIAGVDEKTEIKDFIKNGSVQGALAEDDTQAAVKELQSYHFGPKDAVVGIAASGRTPYVLGALKYAKEVGGKTITVAAAKNAQMSQFADAPVEAVIGQETITGSTRMKSGTAQKMVLNMISTGVAVKMGKTYSNMMVDMKPSNSKTRKRAIGIISQITGVEEAEAEQLLTKAKDQTKEAIVMKLKSVEYPVAKEMLEKVGGVLRKIID